MISMATTSRSSPMPSCLRRAEHRPSCRRFRSRRNWRSSVCSLRPPGRGSRDGFALPDYADDPARSNGFQLEAGGPMPARRPSFSRSTLRIRALLRHGRSGDGLRTHEHAHDGPQSRVAAGLRGHCRAPSSGAARSSRGSSRSSPTWPVEPPVATTARPTRDTRCTATASAKRSYRRPSSTRPVRSSTPASAPRSVSRTTERWFRTPSKTPTSTSCASISAMRRSSTSSP